jgi:DNA repair exonuclease SbcCD ATPase subunit
MERREPTLSSSSTNAAPERDEPSARRPSPDRPVDRQADRQVDRPAPRASIEREVTSSSTSPLAVIALLLALAGLGLGGYFAMKLMDTQAELKKADTRIADLENRLSMSSDESSQSLTQVDAKLKWVDSEIRKLWGISNDVNRKAISANSEKITELGKGLAAAKKDATDAKSAAATLQPQLAESKTAITAALAKVDSATSGFAEQRKRIQDLTEQLDRTEAQLANLRTLEQKVRTNEEAIAAIDAYRRTINRDILQIKQQLGIISAN